MVKIEEDTKLDFSDVLIKPKRILYLVVLKWNYLT